MLLKKIYQLQIITKWFVGLSIKHRHLRKSSVLSYTENNDTLSTPNETQLMFAQVEK